MVKAHSCSLGQRRDHIVGRNSSPDMAPGTSSLQHRTPGSWLAGIGLFKPCSVKVGPSVGQGGVSSGEIGSGLNKAGLSTDRHILPSPVCQVY